MSRLITGSRSSAYVGGKLVDIGTSAVYQLQLNRNIIASDKNAVTTTLTEETNVIIVLSPTHFSAELQLLASSAFLTVLIGEGWVRSVPVPSGESTLICNGELIQLGTSVQLQFYTSTKRLHNSSKRTLPRDPLFRTLKLNSAHSRPPTPRPVMSMEASFSNGANSSVLHVSLLNTLKRVSRDVQQRKTGSKDSKQPSPPMYEQVGNSVAYQLLLQSNPCITEKLINSMYPALKELQASTEWLFKDYLEAFNAAIKRRATPQCLHPADDPTINFLLDLCVQVSSLPPAEGTQRILSANPTVWMQMLAIFSKSPQNQQTLINQRSPSKVVGCMNLTSMADNVPLQCYCWEVLTNVVTIATPQGKKPAIQLQAVILLLSHIRRQLEHHYHIHQLVIAILHFITNLATTARTCMIENTTSEDKPLIYTQSEACEIMEMFETNNVRQTIMDLPEHLQEDTNIRSAIQSILIILSPLCKKSDVKSQSQTPVPPLLVEVHRRRSVPVTEPVRSDVPPPKPRRLRPRTQLIHAEAPEPSTTEYQTRRKLPDVPKPVLRQSKSSENLLDEGRPLSLHCDAELSLPVHLIPRPKPKGTRREISNTRVKKVPMLPPTIVETHRQSIAGPEMLSHYNRVSVKRRKERGSYEKAVTASQIKYVDPKKQSTGRQSQENKLREELEQSHAKVIQSLSERKAMLISICEMWKEGKNLQAASNVVMTCFFDVSTDIPLFMNCLDCFNSQPSHWTLGVCIVLLPYLRRVVALYTDPKYISTVSDTLDLLMEKFSTALAEKQVEDCRQADSEQQQACYHELHLLNATVIRMLKKDNLTVDGTAHLEKLRRVLTPFVSPL